MSIVLTVLAQAGLAQTLPTVTLPKPDSAGWIGIFRGTNKPDFSLYTGNGAPASEAAKTPANLLSKTPISHLDSLFFSPGGDTIVTSGKDGAQLIFKQVFSHYMMEVQLRWPGPVFNTGTMEKIQWNDNGQGGGLPTCVECQGDPNQGIGQVWCLGANGARPWISFKGKSDSHGAIADSTQKVMDYGGAGGNTNCIVGFPGWQKPYPDAVKANGWITIRTEVHGKDTTRHFVDNQKVMEYWNPRIAKTDNPNNVSKTLTEGMLSVQSEGGAVWYRGWRIKLLPQDPLYASLYPTSILLAPQPVRKTAERYTLGFNGSTLTILSQGRPVSTLTGKRVESRLISY